MTRNGRLDWLVRASNVQILHIAFFIQLTFGEYITQMFCYYGTLTPEQLAHLLLSQPDCILLHTHFDGAAFSLINVNFAHRVFPVITGR